jgi:hypothetical protein
MPDKSQNQTVAMNIAKAIQAGEVKPKTGTASAEIAKSMKPSDLGDFGGPINKTLPKKVPRAAKGCRVAAAANGAIVQPPGPAQPGNYMPAPPPAPAEPMGQGGMMAQGFAGRPTPKKKLPPVKNVGKPIKKMRFM